MHSPALQEDKVLDVLIIDDSIQAREFLKLKLPELTPPRFQLNIRTAINAHEGIAWCKKQDFDLIFLDVEMPLMDGYEACEQIRQLTNARIAMLTGKSMAEDFRKGNESGCNHYLVKPPHDADIRVILLLTSMKK